MSSTAVVPYSEMERMATTVAKSGLFGIKDKDQALALMALSQAEGIHPMTAVRDFHIIQGRASMKADTMLARFQQAGGKVEWTALTDIKAEAILSHPQGGSVTIEWTIERATRAGLAGKEIWKSYPRAMLRARVISEGIRTVYPAVISGTYTPEEVMHIETVEPINVEAVIQSADRPGISSADVETMLFDIKNAADLNAAKAAYQVAHKAAVAKQDELRIGTFALAYEARKGELSAPAESSGVVP